MPSRERVVDLIARVEHGDFLGAFEEFYSEGVVMRENANQATIGKDANRRREQGFVGAIRQIHENRAESVVIDGNRVAIHWKAEYTLTDGSRVRFDQVALQQWEDERIVSEGFFYDPASLAVAPTSP